MTKSLKIDTSDLVGQVVTRVTVGNYHKELEPSGEEFKKLLDAKAIEYVRFYLENGLLFEFSHEQQCCENVTLEDIIGDLSDLVGSPITLAERSTVDLPEDQNAVEVSGTATFYKFATIKGYVDLRWVGTSSGFYSEEADLTITNKNIATGPRIEKVVLENVEGLDEEVRRFLCVLSDTYNHPQVQGFVLKSKLDLAFARDFVDSLIESGTRLRTFENQSMYPIFKAGQSYLVCEGEGNDTALLEAIEGFSPDIVFEVNSKAIVKLRTIEKSDQPNGTIEKIARSFHSNGLKDKLAILGDTVYYLGY